MSSSKTDTCNLVEAWLAMEVGHAGGYTAADALADMNRALSRSDSPQRLSEWRHGRRAIPPAVQRYMLEYGAVATALHRGGLIAHPGCLDERQIDMLLACLLPPERR